MSLSQFMHNNNNNNNNNQDDIHSAVIMTTGHCESSFGSFDELQNSAQAAVDSQTKLPDLGCESTCIGSYRLQPPSPFIIITQPESWYIYRPT